MKKDVNIFSQAKFAVKCYQCPYVAAILQSYKQDINNIQEDELPDEWNELVTEIEMMYELRDSQGVVKLIEVLYDNNEVNIVMEYAEHGTLCQFIKNPQRRLSEDEVKIIIK